MKDSNRSPGLAYLTTALAAGTLSIVIALALNWAAARSVAEFNASTSAPTAKVVELDYAASTPVSVRVSTVARTVQYHGIGGLVTGVFISEGNEVNSGYPIMQIDGVNVVAVTSENSFYRDLTIGSVGDDVLALQEFLQSLGLYSGATDGEFGAITAAAVKAFQESIGARGGDGVFRPGYVVRMPSDRMVPTEVLIAQDQAIAPGTAILKSLAMDGAPALQSVVQVPDGDYSITVSGATFRARSSDGEWITQIDDATTFLTEALSPDSVETTGLHALQGTALQTQATPALSIPPAALIMGEQGAYCVAVPGLSGSTIVRVQLIGADISGAALVHANQHLAPDDTVELRPGRNGQQCY